jgi:hypothetical protein
VGNERSGDGETRGWDATDRVASEFEEALKRSERPSIGSALARVGPDARARLLRELVGLEIVYRRRAGESVSLVDYEASFPEIMELAPDERSELRDWIERSLQEETSSLPAQIGQYPILAELDKGGQARTFRAFHPGLKRTVVLKLARRPAEPGTTDRIESEGRTLASLRHPHLVAIHDKNVHAGYVYLVLEDVSGSTLEQCVKDRTVDSMWSARIVAAIARAVHVAHEHGVTHQDLNPRNVLIDTAGEPRVIDFGVAWHRPWWVEGVDDSSIGGTLHYLAPEQAWGHVDRIGRTTDVFGLGGILYYLLTGKKLYPGENLHAVLQLAREARFDRAALEAPGIRAVLRRICLKALALEPRDRYATAADLAQALERFAAPRRWRYPALLVALFALTFALAWGIQAYRRAETPGAERPAPHALEVRIWRPETRFLPLLRALPIRSGDEVQLCCRVKKGQGVSLFLFNPAGRMQFLRAIPPSASERDAVYPEPEKTQELSGPAGTELILAVGGSAAPTPEEVQRLWEDDGGAGALPELSPATIARLTGSGVYLEGEQVRDLGAIRDRSDPQERLRERLDDFRKRLAPKWAVVEGVAFAHK